MKQSNINFCIEVDKVKELDVIAAAMNRDRNYVLNEAVSVYLELHHWQIEHIQESLRQADAGEFAVEEDVKRAFQRKTR